ncbi:hypothetical protein [Methylocaldum sp.]|uniref:hypothetical protein n=1 Tax=Methylocaldum sp. TaxID=1969727 RepID=UPI002D478146|nr:hypothetical protein [Methylocaldum sp.]HYE37264.1 hypothetical protein [Methylocaldum sp.]
MTASCVFKLLARIEIQVFLAAVLLAGACIGIGGLIADSLVTVRLLGGPGG